MPHENQGQQAGSDWDSQKHKLMAQKNVATLKALLRGVQSEQEAREWLGAANKADASTEIKEYCAHRIRQLDSDE